jgi:rhamnulokinase
LWMIQRCRAEWARAGTEHSYETLAVMAAQSDCTSAIDAADGRLLNPDSMVATVQAMCAESGQAVPDNTADTARCVFNSLAHTSARVLREVETVTGEPIDTVHIIGGGVKNTLLNALIGAASGKRIIAGPAEATALGNLLVQAGV